jgi:hypothetical protein
VRFTSNIRKVALASAAVLVASVGLIGPATQAHAVDGITKVTLTSSKFAVPASTKTVTDLTLGFTGPTDTTITYSATAKVTVVKSPVKKSLRKLPPVSVAAAVTPGVATAVHVTAGPNTSRGEYRVTVVVTQKINGVATASTTINSKVILFHSAVNSESLTKWGTFTYWPKAKTKLIVRATAPKYLAGSKVTVKWVSLDGTKSRKIGSGKVSSSGKIKIKTKKVSRPAEFYLELIVKGKPYVDSFAKWGHAVM